MMMHTKMFESVRCQKGCSFTYNLLIRKILAKICFFYNELECAMTEQSCSVATPISPKYETIMYIGVHLFILQEWYYIDSIDVLINFLIYQI